MLDELARRLSISPRVLRDRNVVTPSDAFDGDVEFGSYGLDQCLDLVEESLARGDGLAAPGPDWLVGEGIALGMLDAGPPGGHFADARIELLPSGDYRLFVGTAEFGNGTATVHRQIAASALGCAVEDITLVAGDTDVVGHDSGAFASAGVFVAGRATLMAASALAEQLRGIAARVPSDSIHAAALSIGVPVSASATFTGSPRSVAFNVQGFRVAVQPSTGAIAILKSVQAADAGVVLNPGQCRSQVEGGVVQALGAALFEELEIDDERRGRHAHPAQLPPAQARRLPGHRGALRRHARPARPARREADEREPVQPGRTGARQRDPRCHGRAHDLAAAAPRSRLAGARRRER